MEASLYPRNLEELDLSFEEKIYAITFSLEDELHAKGKAEVFVELSLTPEQMAECVEEVLDKMDGSDVYALRRVLGDLDEARDNEFFHRYHTLKECFESAYRILKKERASTFYPRKRLRYLLLGNQPLWTTATTVRLKQAANDMTLREQIEQLTAEVQFYAERCNRALEQLQTLAAAVEAQESADVLENAVVIDGIYWPYRSAEVLRELGLTEIEKITEFFGDFRNFVKAKDITLMEWSVITTVLREKELLHATGNKVTLGTLVDDFDFSIRTRNCLDRAGIKKDVEDLMLCFADGAEDGWDRLLKTRNLGRKSFEEIIQELRTQDFVLKDNWCYVTNASPVGALDFDRNERLALLYYKIQTVEQLYTACQDQNRFTGLRYVDNELYKAAITHLNRYGFCC